ncbi:MAG: NAD(P)/FAD-dependent oxidoreductase [Candidatus Izemoplasmatales bacterium]|jgi:protoporphyrinogen oxidase
MKKIIIIGAGPAGITAGYELLKNQGDYEVTILEASDVFGGIAQTINHNGNRMDIGGHRFFSKIDEVNQWWNEILPLQGALSYDDLLLKRKRRLSVGGPNPETTDRVMLVRERVSRIFYTNKFFDYPISMSLQTIKNLGFWQTVKAGMSYIKATIFKKKETSLENFYINRFGKVLYSMFFEDYTTKIWGRHPKEISADWGAQRVKGISIVAVLKNALSKKKPQAEVETSLINEFVYPKYGPGQLWETAAQDFIKMGGRIITNAKVKTLESSGNHINALIYEGKSGDCRIEGDVFISSMPIKDLIAGMGSVVPNAIQKIALRLPYRDFVTVGLLVTKLAKENGTKIKTLNNIIPDCWIYVQDPKVRLGRIQIFNNWSPYMVKDPDNTVWVGLEYFCQENDAFWNMSESEAIAFATEELIQIGIISDKLVVLDGYRKQVQKAYPAYFDSYNQIGEVQTYLNGFLNLYCIGRNGQHRYNNMDHSMVTAFEAVRHIQKNIVDKSDIWNVNTEKAYHEEK